MVISTVAPSAVQDRPQYRLSFLDQRHQLGIPVRNYLLEDLPMAAGVLDPTHSGHLPVYVQGRRGDQVISQTACASFASQSIAGSPLHSG